MEYQWKLSQAIFFTSIFHLNLSCFWNFLFLFQSFFQTYIFFLFCLIFGLRLSRTSLSLSFNYFLAYFQSFFKVYFSIFWPIVKQTLPLSNNCHNAQTRCCLSAKKQKNQKLTFNIVNYGRHCFWVWKQKIISVEKKQKWEEQIF